MTVKLDVYGNVHAASHPSERPQLSVLIPFYRDDPRPLLRALVNQCSNQIEILALDDGMPDPVLTRAVVNDMQKLDGSVRLLASRKNLGRSGARNALAENANASWVLFLDADMRIDDRFIDQWLEVICGTDADAVFGGYEPVSPQNPKHHVHAKLAHASDVMTASERQSENPYSVCSSNICVRSEAFQACSFDTQFTGWGWEDTSWALSFDQQFKISHVDNPAGHTGLQSVDGLITKFKQSGPNFARLLELHPVYRERKGAKLAISVKRCGLAGLARFSGATLARLSGLPTSLRAQGLKLYRAGIAARYIS
jgi:glycosyltransferase involved in cell wall biosynthesis